VKLQEKINLIFTRLELKKIFIIFFGMLIMGVFEVIGVSAIVPFIAVVVSPEIVFENVYLLQVYNFLNFQNVSDFIFFLGVFLISTILISNLFQALMIWVITYFTQMQSYRLSVRLLELYLLQPYSFFLVRNSSDLGKNILAEVSRVTSGVIMQTLLVISKSVIVLYLFILLVYVNPVIAMLSTLFLAGVYLLIFKFFKRRLHSTGIQQTKIQFHVFKAANEAMSGIKDVKLHATEQEFINRFSVPAKKTTSLRIIHSWQKDDGFRVAKSRNKAIAQSSAEYIILIDGDMILHPEFIQDHINNAEIGYFIQGTRVLLSKELAREVLDISDLDLSFFSKGIKNRKNAIHSALLAKLFTKKKNTLDGIKTCNMSFFKNDCLNVNGFIASNFVLDWLSKNNNYR
jgi:ABC-type multidrug transport system fused ATPase/permease subunit